MHCAVKRHLVRGLVHQRGDQSRGLGSGQNFKACAARGRSRLAGQQVAACEVKCGHPIAEQIVVANHAVCCSAEVASRESFVAMTVGKDHDDQRPARRSDVECCLCPEVLEPLVQPFEKRTAPLCIGPGRIEANDVVLRDK